MIIDCHAHYEPRILDDKGLLEGMDRAGIEKTVLIPLLTDPPETRKPDALMAVQRFMLYSDLLRPLAEAVTKSMYRKEGQWNLWLGRSKAQRFNIVQAPDNGSVAGLLARHPGRLMGWIFINPSQDDSLDQIERWRAVPGMIGVKIHPFWHRFPMQRVEGVARRTEELGLPMLVHLGYGPSGDYGWLVGRFPGLKVIFAHLGVPFYRKMWPLVAKSPNAFMDISSTYHVNERFIRDAVKAVGAGKCLFGTDTPYAHDDAGLRIKRWVEELPIPDRDKERIFSGNFMGMINR